MKETPLPKTASEQLLYWTRGRRRSQGDGGFVYVLSAGSTAIKVGKAKNVWKRIDQLQTGCPFDLKLIRILPGYSELERELHQMLRLSHARGEWFDGRDVAPFLDFTAKLALKMVEDCRANGRVPLFHEYEPWRQRAETRRANRPGRITDEHLNHVGRMSSARRDLTPLATDRQKREYAASDRIPTFSPHKAA